VKDGVAIRGIVFEVEREIDKSGMIDWLTTENKVGSLGIFRRETDSRI